MELVCTVCTAAVDGYWRHARCSCCSVGRVGSECW